MVFAAAVLLGALPWSTLAGQHAQLSSASAELSQLRAENHELATQAGQLANRSTQAGLARQDYGLVKSGQKAYDILPPAGTGASSVTGGGHVPLDEPPVVPGSRRSEALLGVDMGSVTTANTAARTSPGTAQSGQRPTGPGVGPVDHLGARSFWSHVAHTLEFWS